MCNLLFVALLGCVVFPTSLCVTAATVTKIIGGIPTSIANHPYLVSIEKYYSSTPGWDQDCGGSILSSTLILTAAHCVNEDPRPSAYRIRAGSSATGSGGQVRRLRQISIHPKYNADTDDYDVAVLRLASALNYSSLVRPVRLVQAGAGAQPGQRMLVAGWGVINATTEAVPTRLMHTALNITSRAICQARYRGVSTITSRMVCALTPNRDTCQGDSGGPMVDASSRVQFGITSFGYGCAEPGYPGVYADLSNAELNSYIRSFLRAQTTSTTTTTTPRPTQQGQTGSGSPGASCHGGRPGSGSASSNSGRRPSSPNGRRPNGGRRVAAKSSSTNLTSK